ncbi:MAG: PAS domain S-box protein, partial [Coleofasciculus sp. S288]|nr:PAS domain S-box protein [Coleofasciculus sp. S288]
MASSVVNFRLPEDLIQAIKLQAEATGRSKTAVVVEALKQAFGFPSSQTSPVSLEGLHQQLRSLRQEVDNLNQLLLELTREVSSSNHTQSLKELNQSLSASQTLLDEVSLALPKVAPSQSVNGSIDSTDSNSTVSQKSEPVNGKCYESEEAMQQLAAEVDQRSRMLEQVLSASVDHVCLYDRLGRFTYANRALMQSLGLERTELYGKRWQDLNLPLDTIQPFEAQCQIAFATGQSIAEEISLPTVSGIRDYEYILSPIQSADGSIEAVVYTARDITERKQAQELLRQSEQNYRNLFEWADDSIFITDYSTNTLLDVNEHGARRLGYTRKQLLTIPPETFSPPMDPDRRQAVLRQLWRTGSVSFEHVHKCKNGTLMPIEVSSRVIEYGGRLAIQSFIRDITARKQAETALQESKRFIEKLTRVTPSLIYIRDWIQSRCGYLNRTASEFFDETPETLRSQGGIFLEEFIHPDDLPKITEVRRQLAKAGDNDMIEYEFRLRNAQGQ